ncbi:MAG TPA: metalloregulator ArsR/SmtB family transcription factor [Polyangiaceae bacterium]|nr:metalloregulator ArsR/SmtB family transcription factor [Polyangiaceae bacterium]HMR79243.1 metalloregulator ArsR/SmtB family transcription factor [Polyangiaceae bacterium]
MTELVPDPSDAVFRALADPNRRRMLDLIRATPGLNVNTLTESFVFSRFSVMKHLRVLRAADLVLSRRIGKERRLFLNPVPLQIIHDRWLRQYSDR